MNNRASQALDRYITGNYGENQNTDPVTCQKCEQYESCPSVGDEHCTLLIKNGER